MRNNGQESEGVWKMTHDVQAVVFAYRSGLIAGS